jgi:DNA-binding response OmpR family regulator
MSGSVTAPSCLRSTPRRSIADDGDALRRSPLRRSTSSCRFSCANCIIHARHGRLRARRRLGAFTNRVARESLKGTANEINVGLGASAGSPRKVVPGGAFSIFGRAYAIRVRTNPPMVVMSRRFDRYAYCGEIGHRDAALFVSMHTPNDYGAGRSVGRASTLKAVMSYRILLVDANSSSPPAAEQALDTAGYRVAAVSTFEQATSQLALDCPDLLITSIRLKAFNGLHLLLRARADHADLPVIVTGHPNDITSDITRYGATFLPEPVDPELLLRTVSELMADRVPRDPTGERRWPRKPVGLQATIHETSARVVELSYGGLRLEMTESPADAHGTLDIRLPTLGLSVKAVSRWLKPVEDGGAWLCGAEIAPEGSDGAFAWRWIVDSLH